MRLFVLMIVAVLLTAPSVVRAERITGKVIITNELRESLAEKEKKESETNRAYYWNEPNGIADVRLPSINPSKDIAVVLTREGANPPKANDIETVKIFAGSMERRVVVTRPGSTIKFKNVDPFDHSLSAGGGVNFPAEHQSNGAFRPIEFPEEGIYRIECKLVPHFKSYVVVTKATIVVPVNSDGTFALNDVEPGKYLLRVFHEGRWIHSQSFGLGGAQSREVKLDISLKPIEPDEEQNKKEEKDNEKDEKKESPAK